MTPWVVGIAGILIGILSLIPVVTDCPSCGITPDITLGIIRALSGL